MKSPFFRRLLRVFTGILHGNPETTTCREFYEVGEEGCCYNIIICYFDNLYSYDAYPYEVPSAAAAAEVFPAIIYAFRGNSNTRYPLLLMVLLEFIWNCMLA